MDLRQLTEIYDSEISRKLASIVRLTALVNIVDVVRVRSNHTITFSIGVKVSGPVVADSGSR